MSKQAFFLTVKDLMLLHNSQSYEAMRRLHKAIRDCMTSKAFKAKGKTKSYLTIGEYCKFEDLTESEVLGFLQREKNSKKRGAEE